MNILQAEDLVKGMPDGQLIQQAKAPDGQLPQYLLVSEVQRRMDMRRRFEAQGQQSQGTVAEQILGGGIGSLHSPPGGPQPPIPKAPGAPPGAGPMGAPSMPPQGMPGMPPQGPPQRPPQGPPGMPPQGMARGGIVNLSGGGPVRRMAGGGGVLPPFITLPVGPGTMGRFSTEGFRTMDEVLAAAQAKKLWPTEVFQGNDTVSYDPRSGQMASQLGMNTVYENPALSMSAEYNYGGNSQGREMALSPEGYAATGNQPDGIDLSNLQNVILGGNKPAKWIQEFDASNLIPQGLTQGIAEIFNPLHPTKQTQGQSPIQAQDEKSMSPDKVAAAKKTNGAPELMGPPAPEGGAGGGAGGGEGGIEAMLGALLAGEQGGQSGESEYVKRLMALLNEKSPNVPDMSDLVEQQRRDAYGAALAQLGAGIAAGDTAGGLSKAGAVAYQGRGDARDLEMRQRLLQYQNQMGEQRRQTDILSTAGQLDIRQQQYGAYGSRQMSALMREVYKQNEMNQRQIKDAAQAIFRDLMKSREQELWGATEEQRAALEQEAWLQAMLMASGQYIPNLKEKLAAGDGQGGNKSVNWSDYPQ